MKKYRVVLLSKNEHDKVYIKHFARRYNVDVNILVCFDNHEVDAVVIANNEFLGERYAENIPVGTRAQTVVMFNHYGSEVNNIEQRYAQFGVKHFTTRVNLPDYLAEMLGITKPSTIEGCENLAPTPAT